MGKPQNQPVESHQKHASASVDWLNLPSCIVKDFPATAWTKIPFVVVSLPLEQHIYPAFYDLNYYNGFKVQGSVSMFESFGVCCRLYFKESGDICSSSQLFAWPC